MNRHNSALLKSKEKGAIGENIRTYKHRGLSEAEAVKRAHGLKVEDAAEPVKPKKKPAVEDDCSDSDYGT